jgi:stress responsive alpha/beta barrel protein
MIRHCVMLRLRDGADTVALDRIMLRLANLVDQMAGCNGFWAGPNRDFEDKTPGFTYGFTMDAHDAKALAAYAVHPDRVALDAELVKLCDGGANGILVFDIEAPK